VFAIATRVKVTIAEGGAGIGWEVEEHPVEVLSRLPPRLSLSSSNESVLTAVFFTWLAHLAVID
jgi:hypothetical protein